MAMTHDYLDYLNEKVDIAPAGSQEELQAAQLISRLMEQHDVEARTEDFTAPSLAPVFPAALAIVVFVGVLVAGFGVLPLTVVGFVLAVIPTVLAVMRIFGHEFRPSFGPSSQSQNVVAVHRATGPLVTRGSRTIVLVAHYDTPRENFLLTTPVAPYLSLISKVSVPCTYVVALCALLQLFVFLPGSARTLFWIIGIVAALPGVLLAVGTIAERFGSCTLGANDNKSSVAALLGVLENVRPSGLVPRERPVAPEPAPEQQTEESDVSDETVLAPAMSSAQPVTEGVYGVRRGEEVLRSLAILPEDCEISYVLSAPADEVTEPSSDDAQQLVAEEVSEEVSEEPSVEDTRITEPTASEYDEALEATAERTLEDIHAAVAASVAMEDGGEGVGPKDGSGLTNMDSLDPESTQPSPRAPRPEAPADPEWGKSSYHPSLSSVARRATLFDLPDPAENEKDPFSTDPNATRIQPSDHIDSPEHGADVISAPEPVATIGSSRSSEPKSVLDSFKSLLSRFKKAGVSDETDDADEAEDGAEEKDDVWRGGAAPRAGLRLVEPDEVAPVAEEAAEDEEEVETPSEEELREAVLHLGDDALIAHDIWFVALGGSALDHSGMRAFLNEHRSEVRGCFVVNLDCIGAGKLSLLKSEGLTNNRRSDRRVSRLLLGAAADLHVEMDQTPLDWGTTDATPAMRSSLRSVTIRGVDQNGLPALSHTSEDVPENVSGDQAARVVEIVTEMIRRS